MNRKRASKTLVTLADAFQRGQKDAIRQAGRGRVPYRDERMALEWERGYDKQKAEMRKRRGL